MIRNLLRSLLMLTAFAAAPSLAQSVTYVHSDMLGSPVLETDATGKITRQVDYRPYGSEVLDGPKTGTAFTGHYRDAGTGLVYMQQRYYDSGLGVFLSVDPMPSNVVSGWNFNRYNYAANNPYRYTDPDGRIIDTLVDVGYALWDGGRFLGATAAATHGAITGDQALLDEGLKGMRSTAVDAGTSVGSILVPGVPAPAAKTAVHAAEAALDARSAMRGPGSIGDLHLPGDVPDAHVVVRGGTADMPPTGQVFSGSHGSDVIEAAAGVPHGTVRASTAGDIRNAGGRVDVAPERTRSGQMNGQHVNVTEGGAQSGFSSPQPNPVPKPDRIQ